MVAGSINLIPESPVADLVDLGRLADELGYSRCWVYDEGLATRDVYVTLAAIAAGTSRIELGPGITNPYTRHVGQTAAAVATLDEMSGGRAFLGIGAGGSLTLDPLGIARRAPLQAVCESIEASRILFAGSRADFSGDHVSLRAAQLSFGRSNIEIWLAGRGPRMLALGGAAADGVMLDFFHHEAIGEAVARVREGAAATGRAPRIAYSTAIVTTPSDLDSVRPHMTYRLVDAPPEIKDRIGLSGEDSDRIRRALGSGLDQAAELVGDEWVHPFVISGTESDCTETLAALVEEQGIDEFVLPVFEMPDPEGYLRRIARVLEVA
jgi:5,10-methylenetetrahydromethanopterin reductase